MAKSTIASYKDAHKREWNVVFHGGNMQEILDEIGVNICDAAADPKKFSEDITPIQAIGMVWIACRDKAEELDIDAFDFKSGLYGDALIAMNEAFWVAIVNFSQPAKVAGKSLEMMKKAKLIENQKIDQALEEAEEKMDVMIEEKLKELEQEKTSTESSGNSQASSESIRDLSATVKST